MLGALTPPIHRQAISSLALKTIPAREKSCDQSRSTRSTKLRQAFLPMEKAVPEHSVMGEGQAPGREQIFASGY